METKVLVTYASSYGSTQEIAEVISETLRSQGLTVDLQPIGKVRILEGYSAVVLGAPLYMFHWHKDALRFLSQHRKILSDNLPEHSITSPSEGMLFDIGYVDGIMPVLAQPEKPVPDGTRVG